MVFQPAFALPTISLRPLFTTVSSTIPARCPTSLPFVSRFTGSRLLPPTNRGLPPLNAPCALPALRQQPRCYADGGDDDDDDDDDEYDDEPDVILTEASTGRTLPVGVQCVVPYNDVYYYVCYPMDDPVAFARVHSSGDLESIDDQDVIDRLFPNAAAVLAETHLQLLNTPYVLTLTDFSEDVIEEEDEDEDDEDDEHLGDDRQVEVLAEFASEGENYYVVRPVEEVLLIAKMVDDSNFDVLDGKELEKISHVIEEYIERNRNDRSLFES